MRFCLCLEILEDFFFENWLKTEEMIMTVKMFANKSEQI